MRRRHYGVGSEADEQDRITSYLILVCMVGSFSRSLFGYDFQVKGCHGLMIIRKREEGMSSTNLFPAPTNPMGLHRYSLQLTSDNTSLPKSIRRRRRNAMLHLRKLIPPFLSTSQLSPLFSLQRLLATTAPVSPEAFSVEDYLITTCGLTRPTAHKASKKLSHLRSPAKIDAVLAFLSALGISRPGIAGAVAADPRLLCADVDKNLAKRVAELTDLGLSRPQIARLLPLARISFRSSSLAGNLGFWLPVFGSFENVLKVVNTNSGLLAIDLEKVAKPNLTLLQQCGVNVAECCAQNSGTYIIRVLTSLPERVQNAVLYIDKLGVPRKSPMFRHALVVFALQSQDTIDKKMEIFETLGWSQDDVSVAVRKMPGILNMSEERLHKNLDFLIRDVGLEIPYIARRPVLVMYSHERRLSPRHSLLKILGARGLLDGAKTDFYSAVVLTEKKFLDKFVHPYKESIPGLAATYASSCAGTVPNGVYT